jgi:hypothetical protein
MSRNGSTRHPEGQSRSRPAALLATVLVAGPLLACHHAIHGRGGPTGALALAGPAFGTQHLVPSSCAAGGHHAFYGVDLRDEAAAIVTRVVIDPIQGGVIRLFPAGNPAEPGLVFRRADCETFRVEVAPTGLQVNLVDEMRVAVELDCRSLNGDWLRGELSWDGCR